MEKWDVWHGQWAPWGKVNALNGTNGIGIGIGIGTSKLAKPFPQSSPSAAPPLKVTRLEYGVF